jgi:putative FmdB family regulatory protein
MAARDSRGEALMPTYVFRCKECGFRYEHTQPVDAPRPECPICEEEMGVEIQPAALKFKGTGWYATDYKRKEKNDDQG